jgi:GH15 family glucan-1,4-alpha-glucosidase
MQLAKTSIEFLKKHLHNGLPPASPPGTRYWPNCYPRDAVMIAKTLDRVNENETAEKIYNALLNLVDRKGGIYQRYDVRTKKDTSYKKLQLDCPGLLLWGIIDHYKFSENKKWLIENYETMKKLVKFILSHTRNKRKLVYTFCSIHEYPEIEHGYEAWANATCLAGLKAFNQASEILNKKNHNIKKFEKDVKNTFWTKNFVKTIKNKKLSYIDISSIAPFLFNLWSCTYFVKQIEKPVPRGLFDTKLKGICRYPENIGRHNGGFGPWVRDTAWISAYHFSQKNFTKGKKYLKLCSRMADKNLLPEHVSTLKRLRNYLHEQFTINKDFALIKYINADKKTIIKAVKKSKLTDMRKALVIDELKQNKKILKAVPGLLQSHAEFLYAWSLCRQ